jgi:tetratricopeptide (TPR) repeat protein
MKSPGILIFLAASLALCSAAALSDEPHSHPDMEKFGTVNFPTSCRSDVSGQFTRAVALLHSFGYEESRRSFESVAQKDPACGMAYWGIAMTYWHPIWAPPTPDELAHGKAAAKKAEELGAKTERERGYIAAIGTFYRDSEKLDHRSRALAYRSAIEELSRRSPDDHDAAIFYALSLLSTAPPGDPTFANQKKAADILNRVLPLEPNHPGVAHLVIHSFDYPQLAQEALPAARAYAKIAPSSPHALHMPSHIFTRLGLWQESIDSNIASAAAARRLVAERHPGAASFDGLHALDYLEYAYLQVGDQARAQKVLEEAATAKTFDEPSFAAGYALAAIPARWTLERRDWKAAADLEVPSVSLPWERFPYAPAITHFARALGAARSGQLDRSRAALGELEKIHGGLVQSPVPGPYDWGTQVESMRLAAAAWVSYAEGKREDALKLARSAADLEEKAGKHPVTPGWVLPARELLGDMLLESGRPAEALAEYEASLRQAPARFNSLHGAARAAELSKNPDRARELYEKLVAQSVGGSTRPELAQARKLLARRG